MAATTFSGVKKDIFTLAQPKLKERQANLLPLHPQPDPVAGGQAAPCIKNAELTEKWKYRLLRCAYWLWREVSYLPKGIFDYLAHPAVKNTTDEQFARLFTGTLLSKHLNPRLDAADLQRFAPFLKKAQPDALFYKVDFSTMGKALLDPGNFAAATVTLFQKTGKATLQPIAIAIDDLVVTPEDENAWALSKLFVLQGANYNIVVSNHPMVHFPMDPINALTKTELPEDHLIQRLLRPHSMLQLRVNYAVRYSPNSIRRPQQTRLYTPFFGKTSNLTQLAWSGVEGNSSFQPYRFRFGAPEAPFQYGEFLNAYYQTIYRFVEKVVRLVAPGDPLVVNWANKISQWIPGFPDGQAIFKNDNLTAALATFLLDVTVEHSSDHESYSGIPLNLMPMRMRIPPPASKAVRPVDFQHVRTKRDALQHRLGWAMFFKPSNITYLKNTRYDFPQPALQQAAKDFLQDLRATDRLMKEQAPGFPRLAKIARSIQY